VFIPISSKDGIVPARVLMFGSPWRELKMLAESK